VPVARPAGDSGRAGSRRSGLEPSGDVMAMTPSFVLSIVVVLALGATGRPVQAGAQTSATLPSPLSLGDVIRLASERRDEIQAARARIRAGEARPAIVSALEDPMISPSLDHLPFMLGGADVSVTIEQRLSLSGIREHRRGAALADLDRLRAEASRATLDVGIQAAQAFLMVQERRRTQIQRNQERLARSEERSRRLRGGRHARRRRRDLRNDDDLRAEVAVS